MEWLGLGAAGAVGLAAYAVRAPSCTWLAPSVHRGDPGRSAIALTFDDGPSESTPVLLEILSRDGVRATFFQCGALADRNPDLARMVSNQGHEIGNHTYHHAHLWLRSHSFIDNEVTKAQRTLERIHGHAPRYFRAPYGVRWLGLREVQKRNGLLGIMWTALGRDWTLPAARIAERLTVRASPGAIFCLHDGRALAPNPDILETIGAVRLLIPRLRDQGYRFETISEILCPKTTHGA